MTLVTGLLGRNAAWLWDLRTRPELLTLAASGFAFRWISQSLCHRSLLLAGLAAYSLANSFSTCESRLARLPAQRAPCTRATRLAHQASSSTCSLMNQWSSTCAG